MFGQMTGVSAPTEQGKSTFFNKQLWGTTVGSTSATAMGSKGIAPTGPTPGPAGPVLSAQPHWSRASISHSPSTNAHVVETPSPRRKSAGGEEDASKITPPKVADSARGRSPERTHSVPKSPKVASPKRRLRHKSPLPQDENVEEASAIVAVPPLTPAKRALASGPAPSFGSLLQRLGDPSLVPMAPLKKPRTSRWMQEARGTALFEVSVATQSAHDNPSSPTRPRRYPRRSTRIPPLEFWRGEHLVYTREVGSEAPSVSKIVYNCAPRPTDSFERSVPLQGTPIIGDDTVETEFGLAESDSMSSKLVVLPPWQKGRANPPTYVVPAGSIGVVYVVDGSLRYTLEGEEDMAILNAGDALKMPGSSREALLAAAGSCGTSTGAKFRVIFVKHQKEELPPPLTL